MAPNSKIYASDVLKGCEIGARERSVRVSKHQSGSTTGNDGDDLWKLHVELNLDFDLASGLHRCIHRNQRRQ